MKIKVPHRIYVNDQVYHLRIEYKRCYDDDSYLWTAFYEDENKVPVMRLSHAKLSVLEQRIFKLITAHPEWDFE